LSIEYLQFITIERPVMRPHTQLIREIPIKLEPAQVWAKLADFGNICHGHPAVKKSYVTSTQKSGVGSR
jgi:hypothetical protein